MGVNEGEFKVVDSGFPHKVGKFVLVAFFFFFLKVLYYEVMSI